MIPFDNKKGGAGAAVLLHSTASGNTATLPDSTEESEDPRHEVSAELVDAIHAKDSKRVTDAMHAFVKMTQNKDLEDSESPGTEEA